MLGTGFEPEFCRWPGRDFCRNASARKGYDRGLPPKRKDYEMTHIKLQAALDELERLCETLRGYKDRNGGDLPNPDSDAGRALSSLESFTSELRRIDIGKILGHKV
jgi:hypothetical protein